MEGYQAWTISVCPDCRQRVTASNPVCAADDKAHYAPDKAKAVEVVPAEQLRGAVEAARDDMARHLRGMAADPSWKPDVQAAFEYAASTFSDGGR